MLIEKERIDIENFILIFNKKFMNFCNKLPIMASYTIANDTVTVYKHDSHNYDEKISIVTYKLNFNEKPKVNIYNIKQELSLFFPTLQQTTKKEIIADVLTLNELVTSGEISFDSLSNKGYYVESEVTWIIDKVVIARDEILIKNMEDKRYFRYRTKIPVIKFLRDISTLPKNEKWNVFIRKAVLVTEI